MYEPREGYLNKSQQIPESRTTNSMYQMADGMRLNVTSNIDASTSLFPRSDEVKHRTEMVTRRIQELWSVMQDMTAKESFVPCAERIRTAVSDLITIFPTV